MLLLREAMHNAIGIIIICVIVNLNITGFYYKARKVIFSVLTVKK